MITTIETDIDWQGEKPLTDQKAFRDLRCQAISELDLLRQECTVHYRHYPDWIEMHEDGLLARGCEIRFIFDDLLRIGIVEDFFFTEDSRISGVKMSMLIDGSWIIGEQEAREKVRERSFPLSGIRHVVIIDPYQGD